MKDVVVVVDSMIFRAIFKIRDGALVTHSHATATLSSLSFAPTSHNHDFWTVPRYANSLTQAPGLPVSHLTWIRFGGGRKNSLDR